MKPDQPKGTDPTGLRMQKAPAADSETHRAPNELPQTLADESRTVAEAPGPARTAAAPAEIRDHELIRRIGQGSYGEVWLARNVMGTYRAVKIVYRAAFEHARPFEREFNGIQKFEPLSRSHDGFVDILQVGRTEDYFYYVMELADDVSGGPQMDPNRYEPKTLRSQVQSSAGEAKNALPFEQCVELGLSLTQALGKLHSHGLIHRDIKPSNIIFVNGLPKLAEHRIGGRTERSEEFCWHGRFHSSRRPGLTAGGHLFVGQGRSIDFETTMTSCSPFLLAITVE